MSDELTNSSADDPSRWQQLSYQQFQFLTANASDVIWTTDLDLNLTFVSESVRNVRGYSPNEAISLGVGGALTEKSVEDIKALISNGLAIDATADPNRSTRLETRLSHKDGHEIDVEINVSFLRGSDSKPIGLIGITKDISDRKRLEAAMQAVIRGTDRSSGDGFLNALVKNIASVLNVRGVVVGELKGQTVETVAVCLDGDLAENFTYLLAGTPCEQVMDQSTCTYPVNVQALFPEDQMLVDMGIESYLGTPLLSSDGKVIGVLSCIDVQPMTDTQLAQSLITIFGSLAGAELDRRRSEIERELIRSQLLQAQKLESVGQLTGGIAHDFNNLLVVIQGYLELAQDSAGDDEELTEFHSHIQDAADRAAALTHKLLSFSRRQIMDTRPLDLNELLRDIGELIRRVVPEYISYELITDEDIGTVVGDPGELEQVVMNLAVNARDAMPTGGRLTIETRRVEVEQAFAQSHPWTTAGSYVLLRVSDTGTGVPDEIRERIFEPFFTTKPPGAGTGLGLSVLFGVVQQHRGFTDLESSPGGGTVFSVYLPVEDRSPGIIDREDPIEMIDGVETLLLVEDEKGVRELAGKFLANAGYRVIFAADGEEAVREFELNRADISLVILDVVLPRLGGHEVMAEITKISPNTPVLLTSGYSATGIHTDFILEEELVLLQKPYSREQLLVHVREMIDANDPD